MQNIIIRELRRAKKELGRELKDTEALEILKLIRGRKNYNEDSVREYFMNDIGNNKQQILKWAERKPRGIKQHLDITHKLYDSLENNMRDHDGFKNYNDETDGNSNETDGNSNETDGNSNETEHIGSSEQKIEKMFGIKDLYYIQRKLNVSARYQYAYILLDTDNADSTLSNGTKFGWKFINYISLKPGVVSCVNNIRDLVGMRIFPVKADLTCPINENGKIYYNNVVNVNNNFTILIEEFKAQSFIGRDGRRFHFVLFPAIMNFISQNRGPPITPANPYIEYTTSGKGNGWFWFRTPITEFSTITISIGDPFDLVNLSNNVRTLIPIQLIYLAEK